jgi:phosphatidylserine synthase
MSFIMVRKELPSWLMAGGVFAMAIFMVTTLKVPKFRKNAGPPIFMMVIGIVAFTVFLVRPSALTWHVWNGWNVVCVIANYIFLYKHGYLGHKQPEELKRAA